VSTERPGSIIVFPKVVWDGVRDTIIQITNTSNNQAFAHCFYINASAPGQWNETDFDIFLTKQQPTVWIGSAGRRPSPLLIGGLAPGSVPPLPLGFRGELKCIQSDITGVPFRANSLKGEASLHNSNGDVSKYNAIAFDGNTDPGVQEGDDTDLFLDLTPNSNGEYSACPDTTLLNFFSFGVNDPVIASIGSCAGGCPITTDLTLVPCQEDLEHQVPGRVTIQFQIFDEFERAFSTSTTVNCWLDSDLNRLNPSGTAQPNSPFNFTVLGTLGAYARINPNPGTGGVIGIAEETRTATGGLAATTAAFNLEIEGNRFDAATDGKGNPVAGATDHIILPAN
jgi:hypothetical protein